MIDREPRTSIFGVDHASAPSAELARAAFTLARSFAAGATMWCVAPQWPSHARHVAVEFVHPVIVGKRALPAHCLAGPETENALRLLARPGDILLFLSSDQVNTTGDQVNTTGDQVNTTGDQVNTTGDQVNTTDLLRRAEAWGLTRVWLGAGRRPPASRADHIVWSATDEPELAAHSGDVVLLYHLLWELTHVVFEHPGLLSPPSACTEDVCITCSDEGKVAEVLAVRTDGLVDVIVRGLAETIDASLVDPVGPGDLLLIHAGVALTALAENRS
jgi:hydrogenase maturation factor